MSRLVSLWPLHQLHLSSIPPTPSQRNGVPRCVPYTTLVTVTPGLRDCGIQLLICLRRHRMPREQWWLNLRLMLKMLAHYRISMADYVSGELEHVTRRTLSIDKGF